MTFPGFNAEASLNVNEVNYQRSPGELVDALGVTPALAAGPCGFYRGCALAACECSQIPGGEWIPYGHGGAAFCGTCKIHYY